MDHIDHDVRRVLRGMGSTSADRRAIETTVRAVLDSSASADQRRAALVGRRRFLQIGGLSVATASVIAACGGTESPGVARIGVVPERTDLPDAQVNDIVLLRTASSIERTAIGVYDTALSTGLLTGVLAEAAERFRDDHAGHAEVFDGLTAEAGGEVWSCGNPRLDDLLIAPVVAAIVGDEAQGIPPSDDPLRDLLNVAQVLETFAGETYQSLVPELSVASLRKESMTIAATEARHAAVLAWVITGAPAGFVPPVEAPADPPQIPTVYAIPSRFGQLSGQQLVVGAQDELGGRKTFNVDTPSLNTFVYEYMTPEC
ncbi:MAG: hypothetical protein RI958_657 [Actinomycetota bacterium]